MIAVGKGRAFAKRADLNRLNFTT